MAIDEKELQKGLTEDIAKSRKTLERGAAGRSQTVRSDEITGFLPRALRIGGKIIGQAELINLKNKISTSIDRVLETNRFRDQEERRAAKIQLTKRMNAFSLEMLRRAGSFRLEQIRKGAAADETLMGNQALQGLFRGATGAIMATAFTQTKPKKQFSFSDVEGSKFDPSKIA